MPAKSLTVAVPDALLKQIRIRAKQAKRTVEAEVVDILSEAISDDDRLAPDIVEAIARIPGLDETQLRDAASDVLSTKEVRRLESLNRKAQNEGLSAAEEKERDQLSHRYDKAMVVRATAIAELHKRGADYADLIAP